MLEKILREIDSNRGPMTVKELAKRLDVEEGALEGMLDFLERKGRLSVHRPGECGERGPASCAGCVFVKGCPAGVEKKTGSSGDRKEV